jgi:plastocyanin
MSRFCIDSRFRPALALCLVLILGLFLAAESGAASVSGTVTVDGGRKLKHIVIYLEPAGGQKLVSHAQPITISQKNSGFHPAFNVAVAGTSVRFTNDEQKNIDHNVYSLSKAKKFDIGLIGKNMVREVLFANAGMIKFYCSIHKTMEGVLSVLPSPYFAHLTEPGPFKIDQVPPGKWIVRAVVTHRRYGAEPVPATVSEGAPNSLAVIVSKKRKKKAGLAVQLAQGPMEIIVPAENLTPVSINLSIRTASDQGPRP